MTKLRSCLVIAACLWPALASIAYSQTYEPYTFGTIAGFAGMPDYVDGSGGEARFRSPVGIAIDREGDIFVSDCDNFSIRKIAKAGTSWAVTTVAGLAYGPGSQDGTNSDARFFIPQGIAMDSGGTLYVVDDDIIRKITKAGTNWVVTTIAGSFWDPGIVDGTNSDARFNNPLGIAVDNTGDLYVTDTSTIRKLTQVGTNWVVSTVAGLAGVSGATDGTNGVARFYYPGPIAVDGTGNLYVADVNSTIRKITPVGTNWVVTTIAGRAQTDTNGYPLGGYADGTGTNALFNRPGGLTLDGAGNPYICDGFNHAIRKVTLAGTEWMVTTLAGQPPKYGNDDGNDYLAGGYVDGTGASARFNDPEGVALGQGNKLYVADCWNSTIRVGEFIPLLQCATDQVWSACRQPNYEASCEETFMAAFGVRHLDQYRFCFPEGVQLGIAQVAIGGGRAAGRE